MHLNSVFGQFHHHLNKDQAEYVVRLNMKSLPRWLRTPWVVALIAAASFILWADCRRGQRVLIVSNTDHEAAVVDPASPTGYAGGRRWFIAPENNNRTYEWLLQTEQMLTRHEWRVRAIDYENAPYGRPVQTASAYRWWLGLITWIDHKLLNHPIGVSLERAALIADPILHLLLLVGTTIFVARCLGPFPATLTALFVAGLFPLGGSFLPGGPDDRGISIVLALWSVLPLLVGAKESSVSTENRDPRTTKWFALAGVIAGLGLWVNASREILVVVGILIGGLFASLLAANSATRQEKSSWSTLPWWLWGSCSALTSLLACMVEYFPDNLRLGVEVNSPLYSLGMLGIGALLHNARFIVRAKDGPRKPAALWGTALALIATAVFLICIRVTLNLGDPANLRLNSLPDGTVATSLVAWAKHDGFSNRIVVTWLPLLILGPAFFRLWRRREREGEKEVVGFMLGPLLVTCVSAAFQLGLCCLMDAMVIGLALAIMAAGEKSSKESPAHLVTGFLGAIMLLPSFVLLLPASGDADQISFSRHEVEALVERSLSQWLADRIEPAGSVVLVPPSGTTSWYFFSGLRGLGTGDPANIDGLSATVRVVGASTFESAQLQLAKRNVTHIVLPSWDRELDELALLSVNRPEDSFISAIHRWALPPWLKPIAYHLPDTAALQGESVVILAVTEESNAANAIGRMAEYFLETQQPQLAGRTGIALERYPADLGALAALAQVQKSEGKDGAYSQTFAAIVSSVEGGADRNLAWDRRVSLAVTLAQGQRHDLAKPQVRRCLNGLNERRLRELSVASLYRLFYLAKSYDLPISDSRFRQLGSSLLPEELRSRL